MPEPISQQGATGGASGPPTYQKLSVLMPIYNERWTLPRIVSRVLASPIELEIELVAVDDGSTDGSRELLARLAEADGRIKVVLHPTNRGKGSAIRTAIERMTGDVAVVQDADLEYDPAEFPLLLAPILGGDADAVFGSRFVGHTRRVLFFWHSLANRGLTFISNVLNNLNLTDMETCYKMVRADVLKHLRLRSRTFTLEPELTCRLAQWGARIFEVPVSYRGRSYQEGKKIRPIDGLKALGEMFRCRFLDRRFTDHRGYYAQKAVARASRHHRWLLEEMQPYLGRRVMEAGCGIGNLSSFLLNRERLVLVDREELYVSSAKQRFAGRDNVRVDRADLANPYEFERWQDERLDTVFCCDALEHLELSLGTLRSFHRMLTPGGHCIVVVPTGRRLPFGLNSANRQPHGYTQGELASKVAAAGFEIVHAKPLSRLTSLATSLIMVGRKPTRGAFTAPSTQRAAA